VYQRGEDRCQSNVEASSASSTRSCNDLGYAAAILREHGYEPVIRDYQTEKYDQTRALQEIVDYQPELVMISVTYGSVYKDLVFAQTLRERCTEAGNNNMAIVLKGAIFFDPPEAILKGLDASVADYLIGGEVDTSIGLIADYALHAEGTIATIPAILYKTPDGTFHKTRFDTWNTELDDIPFPARDLMDISLYVRPDTGDPMATIQTSRGCYGSCTFCMAPTVSGRKVRFRSPQNVFAEIEECFSTYGIKDFFFKSDTFTANATWVQELSELIVASDLAGKITFSATSRVRPLQKETLQYLKDAGCFMISFSYESGSDETLLKTRKGATTFNNLQAAKWAKEVGLPVYGFFTIGFPWENETHLVQTRKHIFKLKPEYLEVHIALPYWGTHLHELYSQTGALEDCPADTDSFESNITGTRALPIEKLRKYRKRILLGYYLRPQYVYTKLVPTFRNPRAFVGYISYGWRLIWNLLREP